MSPAQKLTDKALANAEEFFSAPKPQPVPKVRVKFHVAYTRKLPPPSVGAEAQLPEQEFFFVVDRASLIRYVQVLLWDTTVESLYVDEVDQDVVADRVKL